MRPFTVLSHNIPQKRRGGGGYSLEFYMVRLWPFPTPSGELCIPLNCCERHCVKMWISLKTSTFSQFFHSHASVSPFDPLYRPEWLISLPFYILRQVKWTYPFKYLTLEKGTPFGWSLPVKAIIGILPPSAWSSPHNCSRSSSVHVKGQEVMFGVWKQVRLSAILSHNLSRSHLYNTACLTLSCKSFKAG